MDELKNREYVAASAQLDGKIVDVSPKKSTVGYLFWSLALPPFTILLAMYFAWRKGVLYALMPNMVILYSVLFAFWSLLMFSASGAFGSYSGLNLAEFSLLDKVFALFLTVVGVGGGIYSRNRGKKEAKLAFLIIALLIAVLVLQFIFGIRQLSFVSYEVNSAQDTYLGL